MSVFRAEALTRWPGVADEADLTMLVYQSREFLSAWLDTIGRARGAQIYLVVVDVGQQPVMWLPLVVERDHGCAVLRFPDDGMADYNLPILRPGTDLAPHMAAIWAAVLRIIPRIDAVDLVKLPASMPGHPNPLLALGKATQNGQGFFLPIEGTVTTYFEHASRHQRVRKLGQRFRKLERQGPVSIGETRDPVVVAQARTFIEHHKTKQYLRTLGFSQFEKPGVRAFLDRLCTPEALAGFTRMTVFRYGETIVGAQLDFVTARRHQGFMTTYDAERYHPYSPGLQVLLRLIRRAFEDGKVAFDLGHGDNNFKHPWMSHVADLYEIEQALTWRGSLFLLARRARRKLPALLKRLRPGRDAGTASDADEASP